MAESNSINSNSTFDNDYKSSPSTFGSDTSTSGIGMTGGTSSEGGLMSGASDLYEEGVNAVKPVLDFVKNNWMMIAGAGVVLGAAAYLFRDSLPFGLSSGSSKGKKAGGRKPSKIAQIKGGHASKGGNSRSATH